MRQDSKLNRRFHTAWADKWLGVEVHHAHRNQFEKQFLAYVVEQRPPRWTEASSTAERGQAWKSASMLQMAGAPNSFRKSLTRGITSRSGGRPSCSGSA